MHNQKYDENSWKHMATLFIITRAVPCSQKTNISITGSE